MDLQKVTRLQVEEILATLNEENVAKDQEIGILEVKLEFLEKNMKILWKIHKDSNDHNFLGMMYHVLE